MDDVVASNKSEDVTSPSADDMASLMTEDVTLSITGDVTSYMTDDVTLSITGDVTTLMTGDVTLSVTDDVTSLTTNEVISVIVDAVTLAKLNGDVAVMSMIGDDVTLAIIVVVVEAASVRDEVVASSRVEGIIVVLVELKSPGKFGLNDVTASLVVDAMLASVDEMISLTFEKADVMIVLAAEVPLNDLVVVLSANVVVAFTVVAIVVMMSEEKVVSGPAAIIVIFSATGDRKVGIPTTRFQQ